jgi:large subunit ribosomal protein L13
MTVGTYLQKARRGAVRWTLIDAEGQVLGRLASRAARVLMGKNSPDFTPHADHREGVIVINAEKIRLTGKKWNDKVYRHHTGYPGGLKEISARQVLEKHPERLVQEAISGMLPKTSLGERLRTRLKVYVGSTHPHAGQRPASLALSR